MTDLPPTVSPAPAGTGSNKAIASGASGALVVVLIWLIGLFHVAVPPEVASALTVLIATAAVYFTPHGSKS